MTRICEEELHGWVTRIACSILSLVGTKQKETCMQTKILGLARKIGFGPCRLSKGSCVTPVFERSGNTNQMMRAQQGSAWTPPLAHDQNIRCRRVRPSCKFLK